MWNCPGTTDPEGHISYVNHDFINISGFTEAELLGQSHNIVRHPDMPPAAFTHMWATLKAGRSWMGLVKNRCKNGDHYWVSAFVTPISKNGKVVECQSIRTKPKPAQILAAKKLYAHLREGKSLPGKWSPGLGIKLALLVWMGNLVSVAVANFMMPMTFSGTMLAMLLAGGLSSVAIVALLSPLNRLTLRALAIADNPLSQLLYTGRSDEFGQIDFALHMMES
ncbi:PAS domain-containing protein [Pseudomonas sp. RTI1]|uniref:PAS domain-containing protein n=1 Tax=unclassified Pseudomonas TaxID=196821 RepID=UPI00387E7994